MMDFMRVGMRIAHEAPLDIIKRVSVSTDYDYALVHLFDEIPQYYNHFVDCIKKGRYVILDNYIFELGTAFDSEEFAAWVRALKPSAYIVPDVLEDMNGTINNFDNWLNTYQDVKGLKIGVVQGKTWKDIVECYNYMNKNADIIAISFDYSYYEELFPDEKNKYVSWMKGRRKLLHDMLEEKIINTNKPHHLLGAGLPQEFVAYKEYDWIDTIDTSNPVVHGMKGIKYAELEDGVFGLEDKESVKLYTLMQEPVENLQDIFYNMLKFRQNIINI